MKTTKFDPEKTLMAAVDEAFINSGQCIGIEIWRIEKMKVVPKDPSTYGEFYTGDSYIILHTEKNKGNEKFEWNIHFWLGKETSQDEQGVAAYKTVELDDYLGGAPVQYREVQDHESKLFLSYFAKGIRYLQGGVESGFRRVEKGKYEKRLFQIKGKKNVRVRQVERSCKSLNQGDVFLLDCGKTLHLWNGPQSSAFERMKGQQVAKNIRDEERGGNAEIRIIDKRWNSDIRFFADLGSKSIIAESYSAGDDKEFETKMYSEIKLYSVSDASGKMTIVEKSSKPFKQTDLDSNDCFILDAGASGIFVWVGKRCTREEKLSAWQYATSFMTLKGYPVWTAVTRVVEDGETPVFKQFFVSWTDINDQKGLGNVYNLGSIAEIKDEEQIDYCRLHKRKESTEDKSIMDDLMQVKIWKIENGDSIPVYQNIYVVFSSTSCYVILVSYKSNSKTHTTAFYWQGIRSTKEDRTASAIYTRKICEEDDRVVSEQVRIHQGKEPDTFLKIFKGQMLISMIDESYRNTPSMFHIRGTTTENTKAIEVEFTSKSLNSYDVFLIKTDDDVNIWIGKMSVKAELGAALNLSTHLSPNSRVTTVKEGNETEEFWKLLGGRDSYAKVSRRQNDELNQQTFVRLFSCCNTTGVFRVSEIYNFTQQDLLEDDVMLLDALDEIFVWVGKGANRLERRKALETAVNYLKSDPLNRTENDTKLIQVKQGYEPSTFTSHFHGWDHSCWRSSLYKKGPEEQQSPLEETTTVQEELEKLDQRYRYEQLVQKRLPEGVDPVCKEKYLTEQDFAKIFGLSKDMFYTKPKWRQLELKKRVGLF